MFFKVCIKFLGRVIYISTIIGAVKIFDDRQFDIRVCFRCDGGTYFVDVVIVCDIAHIDKEHRNRVVLTGILRLTVHTWTDDRFRRISQTAHDKGRFRFIPITCKAIPSI